MAADNELPIGHLEDAHPYAPDQWLGAPDPVQTFGHTIDKALQDLSIELAGIRAERDGLRLELEGLRTQLEVTQRRLSDRDHFAATVRELHHVVQRLNVPPSWVGTPAPPPAPAAEPVAPPAPAAAPTPVEEPPAPPPPPPAAEVTPAPVTEAPPSVQTMSTPAAPATPEPGVDPTAMALRSPEPISVPDPAAFPPETPQEAAPTVAFEIVTAPPAAAPVVDPPSETPERENPLMAPDPVWGSFAGTAASTNITGGAPAPSERGVSLVGAEERFFDQPGVWFGEPERRAPRFDGLKTWGRRIGTGLIGLVVLVILLVSVGPKFLPYQTYFVRSGSMSPTFDTGDMIVLGKTDANDIKERDIITFERPDRPDTLVTHRVVAVERSDTGGLQFQTQGDANGQRDAWRVPATGTGWKYAFRIPNVGYVFGYLGTPQMRLALLAIPAVILGILSLLDIWKAPPASRRRS